VDRDDIMTLATAVLGGLGAVALLMGALAEAIGLRGGDVTLYAGLAMLLASAVMLALLLVPARRLGSKLRASTYHHKNSMSKLLSYHSLAEDVTIFPLIKT
jgi:hypothetical protein